MRSSAIVRLLPAAYQRAAGAPDGVLAALLDVMETLHVPDEEILVSVDALFAPYTAREAFLPFLTGWVGLDHLAGITGSDGAPRLLVDTARLRDLIAHAAELAQLRGTPRGLLRFLEIATATTGFEITAPRPFHFVVRVPDAAVRRWAAIQHIVAHEKPVASTYELVATAPGQEAG